MSTYEFSVPCLFGLEGIAGDELRRLDIPNVRVENGRVLFSGEARDMAKANICLRTGERVLIVLADFPAKTFEELFQGVYHANLEDFIPKDGSFPVKGHCLNSQLMSVPDCQAIVKKAASRRLGEKYGVSWLPETGAKYQLQFSIMNDRVQLYLDTSGQGLHKRGYRAVGVEAPLRETLAAALIMLTPWHKDRIFVDPFCGSGTFPIEAAMMAANIAPGMNREFTAEQWENLIPKKEWYMAIEEANDNICMDIETDIQGFDLDENVIKIARQNAVNAGVDKLIHFQARDVRQLSHAKKYGFVITNPPYGERLEEKEALPALYTALGQQFAKLDSWSAYVITSCTDIEKYFGRKADKNRKIYNGMLKTYFYSFLGPKPPKKNV